MAGIVALTAVNENCGRDRREVASALAANAFKLKIRPRSWANGSNGRFSRGSFMTVQPRPDVEPQLHPITADHATHFSDLVHWRRDVRRFRRQPVPPAVLDKVLALADLAPSVGNSQPWRIINVVMPEFRAQMRANFEAANQLAAEAYANPAERAGYLALKLAGFDTAPVHLAIFCDGSTAQGRGLGRQTMPEMLNYSCVAMITTLWYAARAEGLGMGWVSILDPGHVRTALSVTESWSLIAYLLLGEPEDQHIDPELERFGWQKRTPASTRLLQR